MFRRFDPDKILPVLDSKGWSIGRLAKRAGVAKATADNAVYGGRCTYPTANKICEALGIVGNEWFITPPNRQTKKTCQSH